MGTKCRIIMQLANGVEYVDILNDGNFEKVGKKLKDIYNNYKYIQMIMNRGDIALLGENLKTFSKEDNTSGTIDYRQLCKLKKVESKREHTLPRKCESISTLMLKTDVDYMYYFNRKEWYGIKVEEQKPYLSMFKPLKEVLA